MSQSHGTPIDIRAEYDALTELAASQQDRVLSPQEELGGLAPSDERFSYVPFAESLFADPRKVHIARGLGELGLITVAPTDVHGMNSVNQHHYAAALLDYKTNIDGRAHVFRTSGTDGADWFQRQYPGADEEWAVGYGNELLNLGTILSASRLYATIERIKEADPKAVRHAQQLQKHASPAGRVVVQRKSTGRIMPVRQPKRVA